MTQQQNNKTNNRRVTANGVTRTVSEWAEHTGIARWVIDQRLCKLGWSPEDAINTPTNTKRRKWTAAK
jgi:hypothetical protein